jgi:hypothetical protein
MGLFLCYDIRGIQSFIFKIPKLKYIIGGSALIDRFDRETVCKNVKVDGTEHIYSAGGKGAFFCDPDSSADDVQKVLIDEAHKIGLDIRFGRNANFSEAALNTDTLFPFVPKDLEGEPCNTSGLYPVPNAGDEHEIIKKRLENNRWFEKILLDKIDFTSCIDYNGQESFFRNVNSEDEEGKKGARALGDRNRWAIICMDGNDMGMQFHEKVKTGGTTNLSDWIKDMSSALDRCTSEAVMEGIKSVVTEWYKKQDNQTKSNKFLPVRPLVVGGDDITILCHVSYATLFVNKVKEVFNNHSKFEHTKAKEPLWVATNGELTISAGILYCPVTLPLHMAILYTEQLLASAKSRGRMDQKKPSTPCLDWEQITESVLDSPKARRERELMFHDADLDKDIVLTTRPCTFDEFKKIEELAENYKNVPASIRYKVLPALKKGYSERLAFTAEILKHQEKLANDIWEYDKTRETKWVEENGIKKTPVIDALLLLEENKRMEKETDNG